MSGAALYCLSMSGVLDILKTATEAELTRDLVRLEDEEKRVRLEKEFVLRALDIVRARNGRQPESRAAPVDDSSAPAPSDNAADKPTSKREPIKAIMRAALPQKSTWSAGDIRHEL